VKLFRNIFDCLCRGLWAVPVQAGKVCNHRASPNRQLSSIPKNGYGPANMQCAGRATTHREPRVDGKIRRPDNVCFREAAARHAMAGQSPERAVRGEAYDAATTKSSMLSMVNTGSNWAFVVSGDYGQQSHHAGVQRISRPYASHRRPRIWSTTETNFIMVVVSVDCRPEQDFRFRTFVSGGGGLPHELGHAHYPDHLTNVWMKVEQHLPDWQNRKAWLAENGTQVECL